MRLHHTTQDPLSRNSPTLLQYHHISDCHIPDTICCIYLCLKGTRHTIFAKNDELDADRGASDIAGTQICMRVVDRVEP